MPKNELPKNGWVYFVYTFNAINHVSREEEYISAYIKAGNSWKSFSDCEKLGWFKEATILEILKRKSPKTKLQKHMIVARNWIENNFSETENETVYSFLDVCADLYIN